MSAAPVAKAVAAHAIAPRASGRPWTFYVLLAVFVLYVLALYGPMICIYVLSFQDVRGGLVFPMKGLSLHWFVDLFTQVRTGDVKGSFDRSVKLAVIVTIITVVVSFLAGLAFRRRFRGDGIVFYLMIGSLVAPGLVLSIGIGLLLNFVGIPATWYTSAVGAQLSWTLPFGVLVMFAVMSRFDRAWEEATTISAPRAGRPCGSSSFRSWRPVWSPWRCSASRSPMTNLPAPCRPRVPSTRFRSKSGA